MGFIGSIKILQIQHFSIQVKLHFVWLTNHCNTIHHTCRATAEHLAWLFVTITESWELLNAEDATTFQLFRLKFDFNSENGVKLSHIVN